MADSATPVSLSNELCTNENDDHGDSEMDFVFEGWEQVNDEASKAVGLLGARLFVQMFDLVHVVSVATVVVPVVCCYC